MLAGMLDDWIRQSSGAPQIVCLAAAAELGVAERGIWTCVPLRRCRGKMLTCAFCTG
jgi:hypothetical protein